MEDTIIALLNNNLRVIIPDFGAFIIRQKQPRIIVFNEFLRYNDGILIDFIVKTEGIDREIAEQRVADFAEDGTKLLASGRELKIEGLGSLRKDSSGKISFIEAPEIVEIENKDTAVAEKIPEVEEKREEPVIIETNTAKNEIPQSEGQIVNQEKPKQKKSAGAKPRAKKAPGKIKSTRSKSLTKPLISGVRLSSIEAEPVEQAIDVITAEPEAAIEAALVEKALEVITAEPEAAIEAAPVEHSIEDVAAEPEAFIESAPVEHGIEAVAVEQEASIEAAPVEHAIEAVAVEPEKVIESHPAEPQAINEVPTPLAPPSDRKPPEAAGPSGTYDGSSSVSTNRILAWVLIILFVNAGILGWFVFRNKAKKATSGKVATTMISDTLYDRLADSVRAAAMDTSIVYSEVPDNQSNVNENALTPGSRYYIVAGCFRDEINADSLVSSLKLLGYKAEKFGKIGNLFAVCFASFDNKDMAVSELKKIREKVPSAWMTKF
jgi:nucleoid DNA-binding protein